MLVRLKSVSLLLLFVVLTTVTNAAGSCMGCLELDELTFDKMISKFQYSLVKFDIAFPYGEKHEAYGEFAKTIAPKLDELLVGLVGVKDYGDKENSNLAKKYKVNEKKFPVILLFKNYSSGNYIRYPDERPITIDNIKKFVKDETGLYIGLDGCLREFDALVTDFADKTDREQLEVITSAEQIQDALEHKEDKDKAKVYLVIMKRIMDRGIKFVQEEQRRLENLLQGKISDNKKQELVHRLNILGMFNTRHHRSTTSNEQNEEL